jgi:hypothetical protein
MSTRLVSNFWSQDKAYPIRFVPEETANKLQPQFLLRWGENGSNSQVNDWIPNIDRPAPKGSEDSFEMSTQFANPSACPGVSPRDSDAK